jgi:hypothetical protein
MGVNAAGEPAVQGGNTTRVDFRRRRSSKKKT